VLGWSGLNDILNLSGIWSASSLGLFVDGDKVPPQQYCAPAINRDGHQVLQPMPDRVAELVRRGAAVVCNEVDNVAPGIGRIAKVIEAELAGKVQSNLYCTWAERRAFKSHFDVHDVFALHLEGTKTWNVYQGRAEYPINHPAFQHLGQAHHDRARGQIAFEAKLEPGDVLYLPRGQYHDALATSDASIHVTMSTTMPVGLELITMLFEAAIGDPLFRQNLPRVGDDAALAAHVGKLADRLAQMAKSPEALKSFAAFRRSYRYPRGDFALPAREPRKN
jgi:ribosomal protein L16 Arg81 hydroxylase